MKVIKKAQLIENCTVTLYSKDNGTFLVVGRDEEAQENYAVFVCKSREEAESKFTYLTVPPKIESMML